MKGAEKHSLRRGLVGVSILVFGGALVAIAYNNRGASPAPTDPLVVPTFIMAIAALFAVAATVYGAWLSRRTQERQIHTAEKALRAQILGGLMKNRYSMEMLRAKQALWSFCEECQKLGEEGEEMGAHFMRVRSELEGRKLERGRRYFVMYFQKIHELLQRGFIGDCDAKAETNSSDLRMLMNISRPIEAAIWADMEDRTPGEFGDGMFAYFERVYNRMIAEAAKTAPTQQHRMGGSSAQHTGI